MFGFIKKLFNVSSKAKNADVYKMEVKVAGVTFKNGRKSRQAILRNIKFKDEPFNKQLIIEFKGYDYEGKQAIGIYVNNEQIGNVPEYQISEFIKHKDFPYTITSINVYGGNDGKSYGCVIKLDFFIS